MQVPSSKQVAPLGLTVFGAGVTIPTAPQSGATLGVGSRQQQQFCVGPKRQFPCFHPWRRPTLILAKLVYEIIKGEYVNMVELLHHNMEAKRRHTQFQTGGG